MPDGCVLARSANGDGSAWAERKMRELATTRYALLSTLYATMAGPLRALGDGLGVPLVSVLLFGVMGAATPCQLSTNAGALAYVVRGAGAGLCARQGACLHRARGCRDPGRARTLDPPDPDRRRRAQGVWPADAPTRPARAGAGAAPLLARAGSNRLARGAVGRGTGGTFLLGSAFAFCFCPTHFLLFFGLTIPLALRSSVGVVYPGVFALGTALPLLGLTALLIARTGATGRYLAGARRVDTWLRPAPRSSSSSPA